MRLVKITKKIVQKRVDGCPIDSNLKEAKRHFYEVVGSIRRTDLIFDKTNAKQCLPAFEKWKNEDLPKMTKLLNDTIADIEMRLKVAARQ